MSSLRKPLNSQMPHRNQTALNRQRLGLPESGWRQRWYTIIFEADTPAGRRFDVVLLWAILISVALVMLDSVHTIHAAFGRWLYLTEWGFTVLFTAEYLLRLYVAPEDPAFAGARHPRLKYMASPYALIDLLAILPFYLAAFIELDLRLLRALRLLRLFKLLRQSTHPIIAEIFDRHEAQIELYEAVLAARSRDGDPLGYARVLANQGNALAMEAFANRKGAGQEELLEQALACYRRALLDNPQNTDARINYEIVLRAIQRHQPPPPSPAPEGGGAPNGDGQDGGGAVSLDGGQNWSSQDNQPTAEIYRIDYDRRWPYWVYGAQQDNTTVIVPSLPLGTGMPDEWRTGPGCETGPIIPNRVNPTIVYGSCKGQFSRMNIVSGDEKQYWVGTQ